MRRLGHGAAWYYPLHGLCGDLGDEVVVAVIVQECDLFAFCDGGDQQVGKPDRPHVPAAPQCALDIEGAMPVFVVGGQPFVAFVPVGPDQVELGAAARCLAKLELDDAAGRAQPGLNQRA